MKLIKKAWNLLLPMFVVSACETEYLPPQSIDTGSSYYPLEVGLFADYQVQEVVYSVVAPPDTQTYQLREVVSGSSIGEGGETVYKLERFSRPELSVEWRLDSVWTARKNSQRVVKVENNVPLIKLPFPISLGVQWDANALNSQDEVVYVLTTTPDLIKSEVDTLLDRSVFENMLTVVQERSQDTIITRVDVTETYAKDVGLVYKKSLRLQYCNSEPECIGLGIIESGRIYRQTLVAYGKED